MPGYHEVVRPHFQSFPESMHEWHKQLYLNTTALMGQLESVSNRPILDNEFIRREGLRIFLDKLVVDDEQTVGDEHSRPPKFFDPDDPYSAAQRAQRWNASNKWPRLDRARPEIINYLGLGHFTIRTDIPLFDDLEDHFRRCSEMLKVRDMKQEEVKQEELDQEEVKQEPQEEEQIKQEPQEEKQIKEESPEEEAGLSLESVPEYRPPEHRAPEYRWVKFE